MNSNLGTATPRNVECSRVWTKLNILYFACKALTYVQDYDTICFVFNINYDVSLGKAEDKLCNLIEQRGV